MDVTEITQYASRVPLFSLESFGCLAVIIAILWQCQGRFVQVQRAIEVENVVQGAVEEENEIRGAVEAENRNAAVTYGPAPLRFTHPNGIVVETPFPYHLTYTPKGSLKTFITPAYYHHIESLASSS